MTNGKIYLIALNSLEKLEAQYVPELEISRGAEYATIQVVGRNTPVYQYVGGAKSVSLTLDFYAQNANRQDVRDKCRWLEALTYSSADAAPEQIKLVWGELFKDEVFIVQNVAVKYEVFMPAYGYLPQQAKVDITLAHAPNRNIFSNEIF